MRAHVGDEFEGVITGVVEFGFFVQLANLQVDGLVHASELHGDRFDFEPGRCAWIGRRTHRVYRLGMRVAVRLKRVEMRERQLDFELATEPRASTTARHRTRRRER
jgi:ribonuclease R